MPQLPSLDDHTFADLNEQARALIPELCPEWTDHNAGDPGITLVELLAWLTEMLLFSVDQIPPAHTETFLRLLGGPTWSPPADGDLDAAVSATLRELGRRHRAVTAEDYEHLVGEVAGVRRVRCVPGRNLAGADPAAPAPAHVSVVVVPEPTGDPHPELDGSLARTLWDLLEPRRLLTTRHHVVGPVYADVGIAAHLGLHDDAPAPAALAAARERLAAFLDPLGGGPDRDGWPFGRAVYASEVYAELARVAPVRWVDGVEVTGPPPVRGPGGEPIGAALDAHELVRLARVELVAHDGQGRAHPLTWTAPPTRTARS
ncbi:baseplate J/gp47 family protein [Pseudonocardia sp.]|uniref:baseplate J/gp47 family protein n=1 Tax=Pseudonocardia sp. TaxID=60912 RepID=UPI003D0C8757